MLPPARENALEPLRVLPPEPAGHEQEHHEERGRHAEDYHGDEPAHRRRAADSGEKTGAAEHRPRIEEEVRDETGDERRGEDASRDAEIDPRAEAIPERALGRDETEPHRDRGRCGDADGSVLWNEHETESRLNA